MADVIVLVAMNLFWGFVWYQVGKYMGRFYCPDCYEYDEETDKYKPKKV